MLLSHNGFDVDRKMAARVAGIDVILTAHTHDALPEAVKVGKTLLIASGSHGKFLSRLDLDVQRQRGEGFPLQAHSAVRRRDRARSGDGGRDRRRRARRSRASWRAWSAAPSRCSTAAATSTARSTISSARRSLEERDAEIALSPGFRWGTSVLPGAAITVEDIHNATAITYPQVYRMTMTGARLKEILEDVADNLFNPDPYYQQGGDMVRCGGLGYTIDVGKPIGSRISALTHLKSGQPIEAARRTTWSPAGRA